MDKPEKVKSKQVRECTDSIGDVIDYFYYKKLWKYVEQLENQLEIIKECNE